MFKRSTPRADAIKRESDAYYTQCDATADVIERVLSGREDAETARLRAVSQRLREEWLRAARDMEDVLIREYV